MDEKTYTITCTEKQLKFIANAIEDWSRFLSGQCEMDFASFIAFDYGRLKDRQKFQKILREQIHPLVTPELPLNASYSWNGGDCKNATQKEAIAIGYGIYREIRHYFASQREDDVYNVYKSETLRCPEQGPLVTIKENE